MNLRLLIFKEIRENLGSFKFIVAFLVVTALVISGLEIGARDFSEQIGDVTRQRELNETMLTSQFDWVTAGYVGIIESKRPYVLSVVDSGIDHSLGRQARISTFQDAGLEKSRNMVSPILSVFGTVDITFVVEIVLSLFVIMLSFNAISGEKEQGTLRQILSNAVPRDTVILAKIIGGVLTLGIAFIVPLAVGFTWLAVGHSGIMQQFTPDVWLRLAGIVLAYVLYLICFYAVGLFVSSRNSRSAISFIWLLMIWVLFVTIIPGIAMTSAERLKPHESYATLQAKAWKAIAEERSGELGRFMLEWAVSVQKGNLGELRTEISDRISRLQQDILDRYNRRYRQQQQEQIALAETISRFLSPTSAMSFAVQNLAGTGWARQQEYLDQLRAFKNEFADYVREKAAAEDVDTLEDLFRRRDLNVQQDRISFSFREESTAAVFTRALPDLGLLMATSLLFFWLAARSLAVYDVR